MVRVQDPVSRPALRSVSAGDSDLVRNVIPVAVVLTPFFSPSRRAGAGSEVTVSAFALVNLALGPLVLLSDGHTRSPAMLLYAPQGRIKLTVSPTLLTGHGDV